MDLKFEDGSVQTNVSNKLTAVVKHEIKDYMKLNSTNYAENVIVQSTR